MRFALVACLFLALPPVGAAEEPAAPSPPPGLAKLKEGDAQQLAILRGMLTSQDARTIAWGAYEAARRKATALAPLLVTLAEQRRLPHQEKELERHAWRAVLAALVDLEVRVPRQLLLSLWRGGSLAPAVILALENGPKEDWLTLWDARPKKGSPWAEERALGNALATRRVKGFARRLLAELRIELHLLVRSDDRKGYWGRPSGSVPGDGRYRVPAGYPPTVVHKVTTLSSAGNVVLADGIEPLYRSRVEHTDRVIGFGVVHGIPTWQEAYREWLSILSGPLPWRMRTVVPARDLAETYRWGGAAGFRRWAQEQLTDAHAAYWKLVRALIAEEELSAEEAAGLTPRIALRVHDQRPKKGDLPELDVKAPENPFRDK